MPLFKNTLKSKRERSTEIFRRLRIVHADACCSLDYRKPLELMVATILAAQCTDARVNVVTPALFMKYRRPEDYVNAPREELEELIRTCGFFRQKAKSIVNACSRIISEYGGEVPGTMEELLTLDGVGRKTANVLLGECFGVPGIIVDTHCMRLSWRLGFTRLDEPAGIERDLAKIWPREDWTLNSHCLVFHGRATCRARAPLCSECRINDLCPYYVKTAGKAAKLPLPSAE
jgi:endonuclease-3